MCAENKARIFLHQILELSFQIISGSSDRKNERLLYLKHECNVTTCHVDHINRSKKQDQHNYNQHVNHFSSFLHGTYQTGAETHHTTTTLQPKIDGYTNELLCSIFWAILLSEHGSQHLSFSWSRGFSVLWWPTIHSNCPLCGNQSCDLRAAPAHPHHSLWWLLAIL